MNEHPYDEQHAADGLYEKLLAARTDAVDRADPDLAFAADLMAQQPPPDAAFAQDLETSLRAMITNRQTPVAAPNGHKRRSHAPLTVLLEAAAAAIIIIGVFLKVPGLRSFAPDIIREIGGIRISTEPTEAERDAARFNSGTPTALPPTLEPGVTPVRQAYSMRWLTVEQAEAEVGFHAYAPTYVPDGYVLSGRDTWMHDGQPIWGDHRLVVDTSYTGGGSSHFVIWQNRYREGYVADLPIGDSPVLDVTVRGYAGIWIEQAQRGIGKGAEEEWHTVGVNILLWEEDGFTFWMQSSTLALDEMLKIAESLE